MSLIKSSGWKNGVRGQSIAEYLLSFIVVAIGVLVAFQAFRPEGTNLNNTFQTTVTNALTELSR